MSEWVLVGRVRPPLDGAWTWAVGVLAETVIEETGGNCDLIELVQQHCIVPMELALLGMGDAMCLPIHLVALGVPRVRHCTRAMRGRTEE